MLGDLKGRCHDGLMFTKLYGDVHACVRDPSNLGNDVHHRYGSLLSATFIWVVLTILSILTRQAIHLSKHTC